MPSVARTSMVSSSTASTESASNFSSIRSKSRSRSSSAVPHSPSATETAALPTVSEQSAASVTFTLIPSRFSRAIVTCAVSENMSSVVASLASVPFGAVAPSLPQRQAVT